MKPSLDKPRSLAPVDIWWMESGKRIWADRIPVGPFLNREVYIIRWKTSPDINGKSEKCIAMLALQEGKDWNNNPEVVVQITALSGDDFKTKHLTATSYGIIHAPTIKDALEKVVV